MMRDASVEFSVSTWRQPMPPTPSPERARVLDRLVRIVDAVGAHRVRVVLDGLTAAGKTSLGHELACELAARGRRSFRASLDDFKRPWSEAHLYDRVSGEGYYRNAFDYEAIRRLLLDPSDPTGDGLVALCSVDPLTQIDHSEVKSAMPHNGVLIVDGVFACRPEINSDWDVRIWVEIAPELSLRRGTDRDTEMEGGAEEAAVLHRERYLPAEMLYMNEVDPRSFVDVIVDNTDFTQPRVVRPTSGR
jgi:uridine kinase